MNMNNNDIENLVKGGKRVYDASLILLACALGVAIITLILTLA